MTLIVAILAACLGAVVYGWILNRGARREIDRNVDEQTADAAARALELEKSRSDAEALAELQKNFRGKR